jgi:hypothetical protein
MSCFSGEANARNMGAAIRAFCLECQGAHNGYKDSRGQKMAPYLPHGAVHDCPCERDCSLWSYRFGRDPKRRPKVSATSLNALGAAREERARTARNSAPE